MRPENLLDVLGRLVGNQLTDTLIFIFLKVFLYYQNKKRYQLRRFSFDERAQLPRDRRLIGQVDLLVNSREVATLHFFVHLAELLVAAAELLHSDGGHLLLPSAN